MLVSAIMHKGRLYFSSIVIVISLLKGRLDGRLRMPMEEG